MGIGDDGSHQLRTARSAGVARPFQCLVPPSLVPPSAHDLSFPPGESDLHLLVQHPLHGRLDDTKVAGAHTAVEAPEALVPQDLAHAVVAVAVLAHCGTPTALRDVLVQLQAGLYHPDRIRNGRGDDAGGDTGRKVNPRGLLALVGILGDEAFAVAVDVEVDAAGGDDADEIGAEALEEGPPPLSLVYGAENLEGVVEVVEGGAGGIDGAKGLHLGLASDADLGLVEVGLQSCLEDVEGSCEGCGRHATDSRDWGCLSAFCLQLYSCRAQRVKRTRQLPCAPMTWQKAKP